MIRAALPIAVLAMLLTLASCGDGDRLHDAANELPFGHIDVPLDAAKVQAQTAVSGWAVDDRRVREIRLFVDGRFAGTGAMTQERPDITRLYPPYGHRSNRHGWVGIVAFAEPGPHTILAQAVDNDGATRDIGSINVTAVGR